MEWRQNPSEWVDQFISSIVVNAEQLFRGHAELLGVLVHAFPHGPVVQQKHPTSPVVYWGAQAVVGSRPAARVGRFQQEVLLERVRQVE